MGSQQLPQHIRGSITDRDNTYLLEIANNCHACPELLALAAMAPEITEYLEMADTPISKLLLDQWGDLARRIHRDQRQPDKPADEAS
jgi:hypothetical protein